MLRTCNSIDWAAVRAQFPALSAWIYLNTATFGQLPLRSREAMASHLDHRDELACGDFLAWFDDMDRIRSKVARLIQSQAEDIAFIPNTSSALAILLAGIPWRPGDRVVTLEHEFPNNLYLGTLLERHGVELVVRPWNQFYESVDNRTRLVILSSVNYNTGFAPPLAEISAFLRKRSVLFFLDGTQSVGALRLDVSAIQPDMLAVHAYKWLNSPNGAGFTYVSPGLRDVLPPNVIGWRSHRDWRNVDHLHHGVQNCQRARKDMKAGASLLRCSMRWRPPST